MSSIFAGASCWIGLPCCRHPNDHDTYLRAAANTGVSRRARLQSARLLAAVSRKWSVRRLADLALLSRTNMLTPLEKAVIDTLLEKKGEPFDTIRRQMAHAQVTN